MSVRANPEQAATARQVHADGGSIGDVAARLGLSYSYAYRITRSLGLTFRHDGPVLRKKRAAQSVRAAAMADLYRRGFTLEEIGKNYGVTRERVRQLISGFTDVTAADGGAAVRAVKVREARARRRDDRYLAKYGLTYSQYHAIPKAARRAYGNQKTSAAGRGISWGLSLADWWSIWQRSGKWHLRGRGAGYCMCRYGDEGPYAPGNVFIATNAENISGRRNRKTDLPLGVSIVRKGNYVAYRARRMVARKKYHLGEFKTPLEAHLAYLRGPSVLADRPSGKAA